MKCNGIDETAPAYFQLNIFHKEAREGKSEIALCEKILKKPIISGIFHDNSMHYPNIMTLGRP